MEEQNRPHKGSRHRTYQTEQTLLRMIRDGDMNYRKVLAQAGYLSSGVRVITSDPVKRALLSSSNFVALCTRAAIEGGLTPDTAYAVGDSYIQTLLNCHTISDIRTINHSMYEDFILQVHRQRIGPAYSTPIQSCISYIDMHLEEPVTLETLSREIGYSAYHLSRKFKEETGQNIRDYIKQTRIGRACFLLRNTELSVHEIAARLCFCSASHFSRMFREVTGELPRQYRRENYK